MMIVQSPYPDSKQSAAPLCPVFGECGGCLYQNISYDEELALKEKQLKEIIREKMDAADALFTPIVASPMPYHYRNRLDLKLMKTKTNEVFIGFSPKNRKRVIPIEACPIAMKGISGFIPELKKSAPLKLTPKYKQANLVVRSGEDGRVLWGGIGRRSLELREEDYLWTTINDKKIFYSLDTFFQANLSILPELFQFIESLPFWEEDTQFLDLYGGVGLFSIALYKKFESALLIEESTQSLHLAKFNIQYNHLSNINIIEGKVEEALIQHDFKIKKKVIALIDPPRIGLSAQALNVLKSSKTINTIMYLSCNPNALARDLLQFKKQGWLIESLSPFDFFPKTEHLETLAVLRSPR